MTKRFKPFRFINQSELNTLKQDLSHKLQVWNKEFALFPLTVVLQCNPKPHAFSDSSVFTNNDRAIALLPKQNLFVMAYCLLGEVADCFDDISAGILPGLLQQLLGAGSLEEKNYTHVEWFYTGSPALVMTLSSGRYSLNVYLHPQWVLNAIPQNTLLSKPKVPLQEALDSELLCCEVELNPMTLQLDKLLRLKPGDVITTDQALTTPILLKHQQQTVCHVDIGEINQTKSIQIVSSL